MNRIHLLIEFALIITNTWQDLTYLCIEVNYLFFFLLHKERREKHLQTRDLIIQMKIKESRRDQQGKQSPALMKSTCKKREPATIENKI